MMRFKSTAQTSKDFDRVLNAWFVDINLLEPAQQRTVLFEMIAEFLISGRPDATDSSARQCRLQQVRRIHGPAACGTCADNGVNFVDKQNRIWQFLKFGDDSFQPFFEVTTIPCAREQRAHVERVNDSRQ